MKIGTDISFEVCRAEGYLMADGKARNLQPDDDIRFWRHYPAYCLEEMYGTERPVGKPTIMTDVLLNINDLWEIYERYEKEINSMIGEAVVKKPETLHEALWLASDIDSYCGLE